MIRDLYGILAPVGGLAPPVKGAIALRGAAGGAARPPSAYQGCSSPGG